jgi:hypothetical protein
MAQLDSTFINPVLVQEKNLESDAKIFYPIASGGYESWQTFAANSGSSTSSINYNFTLPSTTSFTDRQLMHYCTISHTLTLSNVPVGTSCFSYGTTDAYKAYPFNSLLQTFSGTINGAQISNNLGQYKDIYLRTLSREVISKCSSYTPSLPDGPFYDYSDYPGTNCNVFSTATNLGYDNKRIPRGSYVVDSITVVHNITGGGTNASTISTNVADTWTITVVCTTMEPFLATGFFLLPGQHDGAGGLLVGLWGQRFLNYFSNRNNK